MKKTLLIFTAAILLSWPARAQIQLPKTGGAMEMTIKEAIARLDGEPKLERLKSAALKLADADVKGARGWMRATNWAAVLPVVKFTAEHDMERDESIDRYQDEPDRWGADTDRDLGLQVSAQWNLGEIVFNPDEVRVYGALANRAARREALLSVLVSYYFERRKLQLTELVSPASDPMEALDKKMRIEELTSLIDASSDREDIVKLLVPANEIAMDCGTGKATNMAILGAYVGYTKAVEMESLKPLVRRQFERKPQFIDVNINVLARGYELGAKAAAEAVN